MKILRWIGKHPVISVVIGMLIFLWVIPAMIRVLTPKGHVLSVDDTVERWHKVLGIWFSWPLDRETVLKSICNMVDADLIQVGTLYAQRYGVSLYAAVNQLFYFNPWPWQPNWKDEALTKLANIGLQ